MEKRSLLATIYENGPELYQQVLELVQKGEDINRITKHGESALRVASNNGRFDIIELLISFGADTDQLKWSPSFYCVAFGTRQELKQSLLQHKDLESRDHWYRTPWLMAIQFGDIEKVKLLVEMGADQKATGHCHKQPMAYAIDKNNITMLKYLIEQGIDIESRNQFKDTPLIIASEQGKTDCVQLLLQHGANIKSRNDIPETAIQVASNMEIVRLLIGLGEDINEISEEMHSLLLGFEPETPLKLDCDTYRRDKLRRYGRSNPGRFNSPYYRAMIASNVDAYTARNHCNDSNEDKNNTPVWCHQRFGRSINILPDGRIIEIGGEHEDFYDPDFCIYNDICVFHPDGHIDTYLYPKEAFMPTDFHSTTLIDEYLYIIGCLGYSGQRVVGFTPVYRLHTTDMRIETIATSGTIPGWIHNHKAERLNDKQILITGGDILLEKNGKMIYRKNHHTFCLDTQSRRWRKLNINEA